MIALATVMAGGAIGAGLRYLVTDWVKLGAPAYLGTGVVNVLGSFAMGMLAVWLLERVGGVGRPALFLLTGVLGGFTTFSAFSLDTLYLIERGRHAVAAAYVMGSVFGSVGALAVGLWLGRRLFA